MLSVILLDFILRGIIVLIASLSVILLDVILLGFILLNVNLVSLILQGLTEKFNWPGLLSSC
jgi:hypothetical protein